MARIVEFKVTNSFSRENLNYEAGAVKNIHYGDIHTKFQTIFDITRENVPYVNGQISLSRISDDFYCKEGDIIFADASEDLKDVGKSIEIANLNGEKVLSGLHTLLARPKTNHFQKGFSGYLFRSTNVRLQIQKEAQGSKVLSINVGRLSNITLSIPSIPEQKKVAEFLSIIDERIATQNKIIENLETLIKGLSESLFNQKLRFKNESGEYFPDWKIQKLGQVFTFKITNSYSREKLNYAEGGVKNIHYGDIHTKYRTLFNAQKESIPYINVDVNISRIEKENYCKEGDLIIADASEDLKDVGKCIEIVSLDGQKILAGLHTILARPSLNIFSIGFCGYLLKTEKMRLQIQKEAQGSKVLSISNTRLSNVVLYIPSLEEQTQIVNFLSGIDEKIETEKRILKRYEFQKKHFLRVLFI